MKLRHADLETFRGDPRQFVKNMDSANFRGKSMYRFWQLSLRKFHSEGRQRARVYLRDQLQSRFKRTPQNDAKIAAFVNDLNKYADSFDSLGHVSIEVQPRLQCPLNDGNRMTGELARIDHVPSGGYCVYVFDRDQADWKKQLRFPILQGHFATELNCSSAEVQVGVYSVPQAAHDAVRFGRAQIRAAHDEIQNLLTTLS